MILDSLRSALPIPNVCQQQSTKAELETSLESHTADQNSASVEFVVTEGYVALHLCRQSAIGF